MVNADMIQIDIGSRVESRFLFFLLPGYSILACNVKDTNKPKVAGLD